MTKDITCIHDTGSKYEQDAAGNKYLKNQILIFTLSYIILVTIDQYIFNFVIKITIGFKVRQKKSTQ
jgi:hypothetical protein